MKIMHLAACLAVALCLFIIPIACKKEGGSNIHIQGFDIVDASGNSMGHSGPADNDWTFNNTLSDRELSLFDFSTTVTIDNVNKATITWDRVNVYPNPCTYTQGYNVTVSDSVLLKVVVVNEQLQVLAKTALKLQKGSNTFMLAYPDATFPDKASLRVYYSFSAKNNANYKTGYGDIKICRGASSLSNCF